MEILPNANISIFSKYQPGVFEWYIDLLSKAKIDPDKDLLLKYDCRHLVSFKKRYLCIEDATKVPWQLVAAIHLRECGGSFNRCFHNGEKIIGTDKKTSLVPKDRGPFLTLEDSAIDALNLKNLSGKDYWSIPMMLQSAELVNGRGYLKYHKNDCLSPYIWSFTNLYKSGKYISDGVFDKDQKDKQPGVAAIFLTLMGMKEL